MRSPLLGVNVLSSSDEISEEVKLPKSLGIVGIVLKDGVLKDNVDKEDTLFLLGEDILFLLGENLGESPPCVDPEGIGGAL
mmetsp:Transcript_2154/g.3339  ORF Transcript_2154/g.3339 Transcript_2154/m.3339 type:complete len:81 (+) Transcript_2154:553-795(+)